MSVVTMTEFFNCSPSLCRSDGVMRTMNTEKLLKTVPIIQNQMDVLLDFNVSFPWFDSPVGVIYSVLGSFSYSVETRSGVDFLSYSSPKSDLILKTLNASCSSSSTFLSLSG